MRRFIHALMVALLMVSASGAYALVVAEPCTGFEQEAPDEGVCPPTCVTCGCCAQVAEPAIAHVATSPEVLIAGDQSPVPLLPTIRVLDIFHVPRLRAA